MRHDFNPLPPCGGRPGSPHGAGCRRAISIHSLRVEGDRSLLKWRWYQNGFQSTPSVWRETAALHKDHVAFAFQSTPSVWRETVVLSVLPGLSRQISIHSLRVEGDRRHRAMTEGAENFNPLPPCGGRPGACVACHARYIFQSTPSVWRETRLFVHLLLTVN